MKPDLDKEVERMKPDLDKVVERLRVHHEKADERMKACLNILALRSAIIMVTILGGFAGLASCMFQVQVIIR